MAVSQPTKADMNTPKCAAFLSILVTLFNLAIPIAVISMAHWFDSPAYVDPHLFGRMVSLWRLLPVLCSLTFLFAIVAMAICHKIFIQRLTAFGLGVGLLGILMLIAPEGYPNREKAYHASCACNIKQMCLALKAYALDYDGYLPPAPAWSKTLYPYIEDSTVYKCPSAYKISPLPTYSLNRVIAGSNCSGVDKMVAVYDSIPGRNLSGGPELLSDPARHDGGHNIGFADGHARWYKDEKVRKLQWKR